MLPSQPLRRQISSGLYRIKYRIKKFLVHLLCAFVPFKNHRKLIRNCLCFDPFSISKGLKDLKDIYKTHSYKTDFGDILEVFENDLLTKFIIRDGLYEPDELTILDSLFSLMPFRRTALDIGSNIGNHCALIQRYFQETHAIEPQTEIFSVLSRNIERNAWKAKAWNVAFSDHDGLMKLFIDEGGSLGSSSFIDNHGGRGIDVAVMTGDAFVRKIISEPVDYMKIDVESHEGPVITGLAATIEKFQPIISMEWNNQTTVNDFQRNNLFDTVLRGYHKFAMYPRWPKDLWPGPSGKVRRGINGICAKRGYGYYLSEFDINKMSAAVVLIPPKHLNLITSLQAKHPLAAI